MEKKRDEPFKSRLITCSTVIVLNTAAFSCSLTAEFNKVKAGDMKLDGSLCSLPRTPAFGLGIAAAACMSVAQIIGTAVGGAWVYLRENKFDIGKNRVALAYLISSWRYCQIGIEADADAKLCYGLGVVMLGTGASMNNKQSYGKGWMDGECYVVKNGVFGGAAAIAIIAGFLILGFTSTLLQPSKHRSMGPEIAIAVQGRDKQVQ